MNFFMDLTEFFVNFLPFSIQLRDIGLVGEENTDIFVKYLYGFDEFVVVCLWYGDHLNLIS